MRAKLVHLAMNCLVSAVSLLACFLVLELIVFRYILVPDDVVANVTINEVVRYQPGTKAVFRHPDGRTSTVNINADGWNSTKPRYELERTPGVRRVAVVGDSYVHGAFVDTAEGFPAIVEQKLNSGGGKAEVLRFGVDGAPLSQYLHMLRKEVVQYRPDVVVVPLIHNDFDESWRQLSRRYSSSFLKIDPDGPNGPVEIAPSDFTPGFADMLRQLATFRYLYYETNAYLTLKVWISRYFWGGKEEWSPQNIQSAVDIRRIGDHRRNRIAANHALWEMKRLAARHGFSLVFVMDGVREAVYEGKPQDAYAVGKLNALAAELTRDLELPFIDLYAAFRADWVRHGKRLEFSYDWHWNERGNRIVAEVIAAAVTEQLKGKPHQAARAGNGASDRDG